MSTVPFHIRSVASNGVLTINRADDCNGISLPATGLLPAPQLAVYMRPAPQYSVRNSSVLSIPYYLQQIGCAFRSWNSFARETVLFPRRRLTLSVRCERGLYIVAALPSPSSSVPGFQSHPTGVERKKCKCKPLGDPALCGAFRSSLFRFMQAMR